MTSSQPSASGGKAGLRLELLVFAGILAGFLVPGNIKAGHWLWPVCLGLLPVCVAMIAASLTDWYHGSTWMQAHLGVWLLSLHANESWLFRILMATAATAVGWLIHAHTWIPAPAPAAAAQSLSDVSVPWLAGSVNGEGVTNQELYAELLFYHGQDVLDRVVTERLILQEAAQEKVTVSDAELQPYLAEISRETPDPALRLVPIQSITAELLLQKLLSRGISNAVKSSFYTDNRTNLIQYEVSVILVPDRKTANVVFSRLRGGEAFATLAVHFSHGSSAHDGGRLGFLTRDDLRRLVGSQNTSAVTTLNRGDRTPMLTTPQGLVFVEMGRIKDTFTELEPFIDEAIARSRRQTFLNHLYANARIRWSGQWSLKQRGDAVGDIQAGPAGDHLRRIYADPSAHPLGSGSPGILTLPAAVPVASGSPGLLTLPPAIPSDQARVFADPTGMPSGLTHVFAEPSAVPVPSGKPGFLTLPSAIKPTPTPGPSSVRSPSTHPGMP